MFSVVLQILALAVLDGIDEHLLVNDDAPGEEQLTVADRGAVWLQAAALDSDELERLLPELKEEATALAAAWRLRFRALIANTRAVEVKMNSFRFHTEVQRIGGLLALSLKRSHGAGARRPHRCTSCRRC